MGLKIVGQIERVSGKELGYHEFVERYMERNEPVVVTGLMDDWRACRDWVTPEGKPNLNFFSANFGKSIVQVSDCGTREFTDQKRVDMRVSEFVQKWIDRLEEEKHSDISKSFINVLCCTQVSDCGTREFTDQKRVDMRVSEFVQKWIDRLEEEKHSDISKTDSKSVLYLKDWHFVKEYPEYLAYTTPLLFSDDWLNLYLDYHRLHIVPYQETNDISCSDYRFVYMGAKGSWTPLHADVFKSYSWSANVCGKKRWLFLSPSQQQLVFDRHMKYTVYDIFDEVNDATFPGFSKAVWLECIQEQNEIIYVPSGWYHQVHNTEDTISINHNWFNAYNISWIWDLLERDYNEAKGYIEDIRDICDDFESLCQRNLAINTGMNYHDLFTFITYFGFANMALLCEERKGGQEDSTACTSVSSQLTKNLRSIREVALKMMHSAEGLANNTKMVDSTEILDDPCFLNLRTALHKMYSLTHSPQTYWNSSSAALGDPDLRSSFLKVVNPEELVSCIDYTLSGESQPVSLHL